MNSEPGTSRDRPQSRSRKLLTLIKAILIGPATPLSEKLVGPTWGAVVGMACAGYWGYQSAGILGMLAGIPLGLIVGAAVGAISVRVHRP